MSENPNLRSPLAIGQVQNSSWRCKYTSYVLVLDSIKETLPTGWNKGPCRSVGTPCIRPHWNANVCESMASVTLHHHGSNLSLQAVPARPGTLSDARSVRRWPASKRWRRVSAGRRLCFLTHISTQTKRPRDHGVTRHAFRKRPWLGDFS